ncbi:Fibronectin type III domain-containing protein [Cohnella sp. OV330]|uniref:fibronectin type III domain-containing protein n=1 Tax=Cohnella sp. OV330 TaxID=1855288 RepID=UPI0008E1C8DF|nr:fibronectin type III domain-containing protein [Cohnella sp. OV330]SFA82425.1 Fibronectin type III domain-containing protein [Cohnella sp. OV330]
MLSIVKKSGLSLLVAALISSPLTFSPAARVHADAVETNVALGHATVTANGLVKNAVSLAKLVDGDRQASNYLLIDATAGPKWVQLDLGESFDVTRVNVLNDFNPSEPRTGRDIIVQLSNDPSFASGVTTVFNNDTDNTAGQGAGTDASYLEPTDGSGKNVTLSSPVNARYVRSWANGHVRSSNNAVQTVNTPVEVEVYAAVPATNTSLPSAVGLTAGSASVNSVSLSWTSPGPSTVSGYDIRYSTSPITSANWDNGLVVKRVTGEPSPAAASAAQSMTVKGLSSGTPLYFAMKTVGSSGQVSALSSSVQVSTLPVANIALAKPVTTSGAVNPSGQPISGLTDGVKTRDAYSLYSVADGPKWAQLDLGKTYDIARLNIRNDWGASADAYRYARDVVVQLSNDASFASGVVTVFNNDGDNSSGLGAGTDAEYMEPADGSGKDIVLADTVGARYVRYWANGHVRVNGSVNTVDTPVEIEVYADPQDSSPPAAVTNLASTFVSWQSADLAWTAPGGDGNTGTAVAYDLRYATSAITSSNWSSATSVSGVPAPKAAGSAEAFTVAGLTPGTTYYFALKAKDLVNESPISNVAIVTTPAADTVAPAAIANLQATQAMFKSVKLTWTAPGDDGSNGKAASYDVRYSTSPITLSNWASATQAEGELPQPTAGTAMRFKVTELTAGTTYYFAVRTTDAVGNVSGLSNPVSATVATPTADAVAVSSLSALQTAIDGAPAGGRVITLAAGTYNQSTTINITGKNNITIQGAGSNYASTVVKGLGINNSSLDINFKVNDSDYVTFKNMTIQDSYYHAIQVNQGSKYFHADGLKTWDNGEGGFKTTFDLNGGSGYTDYGIIENSLIGYTTSGMRSVVEGVDLIASKGWIVRGNRVENAKTSNNGGGYGIFAKGNSIDTIFENNVIVGSFVAMSFGGGGTGASFFRNQDQTYEHRGGIIRNNVVFGATDTGVYLNKANGYKVYNNTILNTGSGVGAIEPRFAGTSGEVRNNLMTGTVKNRDSGTSVASNNITGATASWLVDPAGGDYRLHPFNGMAARDVGMTLSDVPTDMYGEARPYGSAYDVGADEFAPSETTPPATTTSLAASSPTSRTFTLAWTAPGDDGTTGTAYAYDIRYSNSNITDANWDSAQKIYNLPQPLAGGTAQTLKVEGPTAGATVYAAMKTIDDQGNVSALSNVASVTMLGSSATEFTPSDDVNFAGAAAYGNATTTIVQNNGNSVYYGYVKAGYSGFAGTAAERATLKMFVQNQPSKTWGVTVTGLLDDAWTESAVTNATRPSETGAVDLGKIMVSQPGWYEFDVTAFVNAQMSDHTVSFKLHDPLVQASSVTFFSTENAYNRPYLVLSATDTFAPARTEDLRVSAKTMTSATLNWTAPGDDGNERTATQYDVRYSTSPITASNWSSATQAIGEPTPQTAGTAQSFTVLGLTTGTTYYFAMKTRDNANNESILSNTAQTVLESTVNVALGKAVTTNGTVSSGSVSVVTDGARGSSGYALISVADGPKWVQIDLGQAYPISRINVLNDWGGTSGIARTGRDHVVQLSNDPTFATGVTTVFNNDTDNSAGLGTGSDADYQEPTDGTGKNIAMTTPVSARYVRSWANGHVRVTGETNLVNTPVELEVYANPGDATAPGTIANLSASGTTWKSTNLSWTAPGDDSTTGTAAFYDIRYYTSSISENNWNDAVQLTNEPAPAIAGTTQTLAVTGLPAGTALFFAIRTFDEASNASALSNVVPVTTAANDPTPPAAIADLQAVHPGARSVQLTWTAPGNDGNAGMAEGYDVRYSTSPITTEAQWNAATQAEDELAQKSPGSTMKYQVNQLQTGVTYYFAVKTYDDGGNYGGLSNPVSAATAAPTPDSATVTSLAQLQQAIDQAPAQGRVITLAAGTYSQTATININGKNNITIQGATSNYDDTVVAGQGIDASSMDINFKVNDSDYVTFKNMTIRDSYYHAIQVNSGSDYFRADHLKTWDNGEGGFKSTSGGTPDLPYADYGTIENSLIGYTTGGTRSVVEGVDLIAAKGWVIRGNTFQNAKKAGGVAYAFFAKGNSMDTLVENNVFKNSFIAMSFGGGGTAAQYFRNGDTSLEHRGGIMRNNVVYGTDDAGVYMNKASGFKVYNNTILGVPSGVGSVESRYAGSNGEVRNNLMDKAVKPRDGGTATSSNNITNGTASMLVNAAAGDYHLNAATASAAIDAGYALPADVPLDMDGQPRPSGSAYDIGADELSATPAAPAGLTASLVSGNVQLAWNLVSGATSYTVKRATVAGGPYTSLATGVTTNAYTDNAAAAGATYYYTVSAANAAGSGPNAAEASVTVPLAAPTGVTATGGNGAVNLGWTASSGATGYNVKRGTVSGGPYSIVATSVTGVVYADTTVANGTTYYYVVSALSSGGESADSAQVSATPSSGAALSRTGWTATSSTNSGTANALDGLATTRWTSSGAQSVGRYYQVNMGSAKTFNKITLDSTGGNDYPRAYEVYVSSDGTNWGTAVASGTGSGNVQTVIFPTQTAQYIKVVLTAAASPWWSIYEFNVYEP